MVGEVAERLAQVGVDLGGPLPRQRPHVDLDDHGSGITFAFIRPPSTRFGENVVWVHEYRCAAAGWLGSASRPSSI